MPCTNISDIEPDIVRENDCCRSLEAFSQTRFIHSDGCYTVCDTVLGARVALNVPINGGKNGHAVPKGWFANVSVLSFRSKTVSGKNEHTYTDAIRSGVVCAARFVGVHAPA